jgi:hypothetical protein
MFHEWESAPECQLECPEAPDWFVAARKRRHRPSAAVALADNPTGGDGGVSRIWIVATCAVCLGLGFVLAQRAQSPPTLGLAGESTATTGEPDDLLHEVTVVGSSDPPEARIRRRSGSQEVQDHLPPSNERATIEILRTAIASRPFVFQQSPLKPVEVLADPAGAESQRDVPFVFSPASDQESPRKATETVCRTCNLSESPTQGSFGTRIHWAESAAVADIVARYASKLVFEMHISGNFADENFT